jgi:hypothetical protein
MPPYFAWRTTGLSPSSIQAPAYQIRKPLIAIKFVAISHATLAAASKRQHRREITSIFIGKFGNTARVESRETEEMTINTRQVAGVGGSTEMFALRGDVMLWTKSASVIENQTEMQTDPCVPLL